MKRTSSPIALAAATLTLGVLMGAALPSRAGDAPSSSGTVITLSEYQALLSDYDHAISGGKVAPSAAARLQARFEQTQTVLTPDHRTITVDNASEIKTLKYIAGTKRGAEADEDAQDRASSLYDLVAPNPGGVRIGDAAQTAQAVLRRSEFQYQDPTIPHPSLRMNWLERFFDSIGRGMQSMGDAISRWLKGLTGNRNLPDPKFGSMVALAVFLRFLLYAVLSVAVVSGLTLLTLNWRRNGGRISFGKRAKETGLDLGPEERSDPLAAARRLGEQGDYRGAVRLAYIASLRRLAAAGLLVLEPNKTNWEYQRDLRGRSQRHYATLLPATGIFDRVWYGRRNGTASEFERMVAAHDALPDSPAGAQTESQNVLSGADSRDVADGMATAAAAAAEEAR